MTATDLEILAIVPAKGRSKGLPRKNLRVLCGRPLVAWTIEAALKSKYVTRVVVSSEDEEILALAALEGADTVQRPVELAADETKCESVMQHAIETLNALQSYSPAILVLLQPTSPLRTSEDIDGALGLCLTREHSAVISGYLLERNPLKEFLINENGRLQAIGDRRNPFMPRQKLPQAFRPNGAIYVIRTDIFMKSGSLLTDDTLPFHMDPHRSIDIDSLDDLITAEAILSSHTAGQTL